MSLSMAALIPVTLEKIVLVLVLIQYLVVSFALTLKMAFH
jgi:hypothetical protein